MKKYRISERSLRGRYDYVYIAFYIGLIYFLGGLLQPFLVSKVQSKLTIISFGVSLISLMYLAIIWVKGNSSRSKNRRFFSKVLGKEFL